MVALYINHWTEVIEIKVIGVLMLLNYTRKFSAKNIYLLKYIGKNVSEISFFNQKQLKKNY